MDIQPPDFETGVSILSFATKRTIFTTISGGFKMKRQQNEDLRIYLKRQAVRQWQVCEALCVSECSFSRKLRHELPPDEKARLRAIVDRIAAGQEGG